MPAHIDESDIKRLGKRYQDQIRDADSTPGASDPVEREYTGASPKTSSGDAAYESAGMEGAQPREYHTESGDRAYEQATGAKPVKGPSLGDRLRSFREKAGKVADSANVAAAKAVKTGEKTAKKAGKTAISAYKHDRHMIRAPSANEFRPGRMPSHKQSRSSGHPIRDAPGMPDLFPRYDRTPVQHKPVKHAPLPDLFGRHSAMPADLFPERRNKVPDVFGTLETKKKKGKRGKGMKNVDIDFGHLWRP